MAEEDVVAATADHSLEPPCGKRDGGIAGAGRNSRSEIDAKRPRKAKPENVTTARADLVHSVPLRSLPLRHDVEVAAVAAQHAVVAGATL